MGLIGEGLFRVWFIQCLFLKLEISVILIDVAKDVGSGDLTAFWTHLRIKFAILCWDFVF